MTKALLTALLIVLVTGDFIDEIDGLLRAGRDRIEMPQRGLDPYEREADDMRGNPIYVRRGKQELNFDLILIWFFGRLLHVICPRSCGYPITVVIKELLEQCMFLGN